MALSSADTITGFARRTIEIAILWLASRHRIPYEEHRTVFQEAMAKRNYTDLTKMELVQLMETKWDTFYEKPAIEGRFLIREASRY